MTYARSPAERGPGGEDMVAGRLFRRSGLLGLVSALSLNACGVHDHAEVDGRREREASPLYAGAVVDPKLWPAVVWLSGACTATFISSRVIVYAAHCGDSFREARAADGVIPISRCEVFPDFGLGKGNDMAYCTASIFSASYLPPAIGLDLQEVGVGTKVTLVGYGEAEDGQEAGMLRAGEAEVLDVGAELLVGRRDGSGTAPCPGDSGGPALVATPAGPRVLAVASSRLSRECDGSSGFYVPLEPWLAWIQENAGADVPACGGSNCEHGSVQAAETSGCAIAGATSGSATPAAVLGSCAVVAGWRRRKRKRVSTSGVSVPTIPKRKAGFTLEYERRIPTPRARAAERRAELVPSDARSIRLLGRARLQ